MFISKFLLGAAIGVASAVILLMLFYLMKIAAAKSEKQVLIYDNGLSYDRGISVVKGPGYPKSRPEYRFFTLSHGDIVGHIGTMKADKDRFPVEADILAKPDAKLPDYLMCGNRCFAMMFERNDLVFHFILRMSKSMMADLSERHPVQQAADILSGENWCSLIIDLSYGSKREVYKILEDCYDFTREEFYPEKLTADASAAESEMAVIGKEVAQALGLIEKSSAAAELQYFRALENFKNEYFTTFSISRREIAADIRALGNPDIAVIERPNKPQQPMSLKYKDTTYAMLYGIEKGVLMTIRLSDKYAEELTHINPEVRRASFPKGPNWYNVPVDGAFRDKESVYEVLTNSLLFVAKLCNGAASE